MCKCFDYFRYRVLLIRYVKVDAGLVSMTEINNSYQILNRRFGNYLLASVQYTSHIWCREVPIRTLGFFCPLINALFNFFPQKKY